MRVPLFSAMGLYINFHSPLCCLLYITPPPSLLCTEDKLTGERNWGTTVENYWAEPGFVPVVTECSC